MTIKQRFIPVLCLLLLPFGSSAKDLQNVLFEKTYDSLKKGTKVPVSHLKSHSLYAYIEFEKLQQQKHLSEKQLLAFIDKHQPSLLADKAWRMWIDKLAQQGQWKKILAEFEPQRANTASRCHYRYAQLKRGDKKEALNQAKQLWMSPKSLPDECNRLFSQLKKQGAIKKDDYWQRLQLAVDEGNTSFAKGFIKYLPRDEQGIARQYIKARHRPERALKSKQVGKGKYSRKVIAYSIKRIARKNYKKGLKTWKKYRSYPFTASEKGDIESYLGVRMAFNHDPAALRRLSRIPKKHRSNDAAIWMARMALRAGRWDKLQLALDSMDDKTASRDIWKYWQAKVHSKKGNASEATEIYTELAEAATFYGFLSADHLDIGYQALDAEPKDWKAAAKQASRIPSIHRALQWYDVGYEVHGNREWFWALRHLEDKQDKLAAAALALELKKPLLAVQSVAKTRDWNQIDLRFPMFYTHLVKELSTQNKVNPAWVYGVMRRESAFNKDARSSANAMGLMQLLPSTARHVGKKLGISRIRKADLHSPRLNIQLGSAYLKEMLDDFDGSYVKATAGYNAGPGRSVKWTPQKKIEADRWVESIPFTETRKYVRAVMAYTTIYDHKLTQGRGKRISERLQPVGNVN